MIDPTPRELQLMVESLDRRIDERFIAHDRALCLQAATYDSRLHGLNDIQNKMREERQHFLSKEMSDAKWTEFYTWQRQLEAKLALSDGSAAGIKNSWGVLVAVVTILVSAFFHYK